MKVLKKFWIAFLAAMPISAGALGPLALGTLAAGVGIIGVSLWRNISPVSMKDSFDFFSSCWTCQMFSDVMLSMSTLLPGVYRALGHIIIPFSLTLLGLLFAWRIFQGYMTGKPEDGSKLLGNGGTYLAKMALLIGLLLIPLPRIITDVLIEPAVTIGTSFDYAVSDNNVFSECMVTTAMSDPVTASESAASYGAFSPKLRHQLACEVANIHQITGLGMTVGWKLLNTAFESEHMHHVLFLVPVFPNIPMFFAGLLVLVLYFFALLPIPLYFLEVFIKLSMDLIMLPLMLMSWVFDDDNFAIFPKGGRTIRQMIDDCLKAVVGIALTVVFLTFSVMFLNAAFQDWNGVNIIQQAIQTDDSELLIDGLMMGNDSLVTVILMGVFIAMFMTMIPQLTSMLFKIQISDKYYQTAKKDVGIAWQNLKKWATSIKK